MVSRNVFNTFTVAGRHVWKKCSLNDCNGLYFTEINWLRENLEIPRIYITYMYTECLSLCQSSFDHQHLGTAGWRTFKIWRSSNIQYCNFLSSIAKTNQLLKKLQCDVLNHCSIKLFPSENKCDMILTPRFKTISSSVSRVVFCWIRQRLK
jgi:hypothetical protein